VPAHHPRCLPDLELVGFDPAFLELRTGTWAMPLTRIGTQR
jgi:hypothetical protein